jgi:hypothetical protein
MMLISVPSFMLLSDEMNAISLPCQVLANLSARPVAPSTGSGFRWVEDTLIDAPSGIGMLMRFPDLNSNFTTPSSDAQDTNLEFMDSTRYSNLGPAGWGGFSSRAKNGINDLSLLFHVGEVGFSIGPSALFWDTMMEIGAQGFLNHSLAKKTTL